MSESLSQITVQVEVPDLSSLRENRKLILEIAKKELQWLNQRLAAAGQKPAHALEKQMLLFYLSEKALADDLRNEEDSSQAG